MCSTVRLDPKVLRYIEKGIIKRAKNPARTITIIHVVGNVCPPSSSICSFANYRQPLSLKQEYTGATVPTTNEQNTAVYETNCKKNLYLENPTIPPTHGQKWSTY